MTALIPMFEKYKLTAGFFGHDHNYQHYLQNGIHYFITGGGGAPLYDVYTPPQGITQKAVSIENFVTVKMEGHEGAHRGPAARRHPDRDHRTGALEEIRRLTESSSNTP